jgi:hypothetical protein
MNVGIRIGGLSSSLAADAVVRLSDDLQRANELWKSQRRRMRDQAAARADDGFDVMPAPTRR